MATPNAAYTFNLGETIQGADAFHYGNSECSKFQRCPSGMKCMVTKSKNNQDYLSKGLCIPESCNANISSRDNYQYFPRNNNYNNYNNTINNHLPTRDVFDSTTSENGMRDDAVLPFYNHKVLDINIKSPKVEPFVSGYFGY